MWFSNGHNVKQKRLLHIITKNNQMWWQKHRFRLYIHCLVRRSAKVNPCRWTKMIKIVANEFTCWYIIARAWLNIFSPEVRLEVAKRVSHLSSFQSLTFVHEWVVLAGISAHIKAKTTLLLTTLPCLFFVFIGPKLILFSNPPFIINRSLISSTIKDIFNTYKYSTYKTYKYSCFRLYC